MNDTNFVQSSITIKKGESVTLVADTLIPHTMANGTWENGTPQPAKEPGAPVIDNVSVGGNSSGTIGPFTSAGSFKLYCTVHSGMNLTVVVQ
jgi:plastocyanin